MSSKTLLLLRATGCPAASSKIARTGGPATSCNGRLSRRLPAAASAGLLRGRWRSNNLLKLFCYSRLRGDGANPVGANELATNRAHPISCDCHNFQVLGRPCPITLSETNQFFERNQRVTPA